MTGKLQDTCVLSVVCGVQFLILAMAPPALAASDQECQQYARGAVKDYTTATNQANARNCNVPSDGRWQPNYQNHYQWCRTVPTADYKAEAKARNDILVRCHAREILD
jgi:hypothetical protein